MGLLHYVTDSRKHAPHLRNTGRVPRHRCSDFPVLGAVIYIRFVCPSVRPSVSLSLSLCLCVCVCVRVSVAACARVRSCACARECVGCPIRCCRRCPCVIVVAWGSNNSSVLCVMSFSLAASRTTVYLLPRVLSKQVLSVRL